MNLKTLIFALLLFSNAPLQSKPIVYAPHLPHLVSPEDVDKAFSSYATNAEYDENASSDYPKGVSWTTGSIVFFSTFGLRGDAKNEPIHTSFQETFQFSRVATDLLLKIEERIIEISRLSRSISKHAHKLGTLDKEVIDAMSPERRKFQFETRPQKLRWDKLGQLLSLEKLVKKLEEEIGHEDSTKFLEWLRQQAKHAEMGELIY